MREPKSSEATEKRVKGMRAGSSPIRPPSPRSSAVFSLACPLCARSPFPRLPTHSSPSSPTSLILSSSAHPLFTHASLEKEGRGGQGNEGCGVKRMSDKDGFAPSVTDDAYPSLSILPPSSPFLCHPPPSLVPPRGVRQVTGHRHWLSWSHCTALARSIVRSSSFLITLCPFVHPFAPRPIVVVVRRANQRRSVVRVRESSSTLRCWASLSVIHR
ncbi:hypothetical protein BDN70DRAFT_940031 [Pholiota conissans]|uniref:Uncharacterized protein n=1 Tax=Pholiota conissans TaxID=109636 RepID=A0A9P5YLQ8_9AGAR|nr:hypothetical protein BDN70DRAFT_940031 [Pholiota conissans]